MNFEESTQLKEGQTVYIVVKYLGTTTDGQSAHVKIPTTDWMDMGHHSVVSISPNVSFEHIVIPSPVKENKPKYDPCRPFKKGDIVEPVACNGRAPLYLRKYIGTKQVVECDEDINGIVGIVGDVEAVSAAFLKLVTPVEELEPYCVKETTSVYEVFNRNENNSSVAIFFKSQYSIGKAKERAEAERDRRNAEYRKEEK